MSGRLAGNKPAKMPRRRSTSGDSQDLVPHMATVHAPGEQQATTRQREVQTEFPKAPLTHTIVMLGVAGLPFLSLFVAIGVLWQYGYVGWLNLSLLLAGWALTGAGITIGFHRLLTHRSFDTYHWVRVFWTVLGSLSIEGSPITWCAVHRRHHELSDQHGDPHSPHLHGEGLSSSLQGLWYAHTGWLFTGYWTSPRSQRYVPDLLSDPALVLVDRLYYVAVILSLGIPTLIGYLATGTLQGALLALLWGGFVRIFITHHVTWSINSICHVFGQREYESGDESRNNTFCGYLAFGEGWHNNHHAFPTSARHGLRWWQFDTSYLIIRAMQLVGLAWNVRVPDERQLASKRLHSKTAAAAN